MAFEKIKEDYVLYKSHYFAGNELYCPFCGRFYRMATYGKDGGKSNYCPICASSKEERTLLLFLQSRTELLKGELKILVISEKNEITEYFKNFPNTEVKIFNSTGDFSIRDEELKGKYPNDHFDVIICNYVLEKLPSYKMVIKELNRIITFDGFIVLQANIDENRETTYEMPITSYNDRFKLYGILGNYRRFGKDYTKVLKDHGLDVLEYDFELGLEDIPLETVYDNCKFYLGYKDPPPVIKNYNDILDEAINEHFSSSRKSTFKYMIYVIFLQIPDILKKKIEYLGSQVSERKENKNNALYMLFVTIVGLTMYWVSWAIFMSTISFTPFMVLFHWLIALPLLLVIGFPGLLMLAGYAYMEANASLPKRVLVGIILLITLFLSIPGVLGKIFG
ncbi:MAG: hypothetical protein JXR69_10600 [Candidatus Delongbacteria bacterium]|nr:hypothetical protein [Candidatus Delongbacteria bacterium]